MANTPITPPYSFLQLADQADSACVLAVSGCLPLLDFNGLKFELFFDDYVASDCAGGDGTTTIIYALPTKIPIPLGDMIPAFGSIPLPRVINNGGQVNTGIAYTTQVAMATVGLTTFDALNAILNTHPILVGDCFSWNIIIEGFDTETDIICSRVCLSHTNCFYRAQDGCYLSVVNYTNRSNAFGFEYFDESGTANGVTNTVTLPMYLRRPQNPTREDSYELSNGYFIQTYAIVNQEWTVETDNIGADWHQKIAIALRHNNIKIKSEYANAIVPNLNNDSGFIPVVISDKYEADWGDLMPLVALCKGKAKVKNAVPIDMINNNCK